MGASRWDRLDEAGTGLSWAIWGLMTLLLAAALSPDRIDAIGGTLEIRSAPGEGTRVLGCVPVDRG